MNKGKMLFYALLLLSPFLFCSRVTLGIEKAKSRVIEKEGKFEIRWYQPHIVAQTIVEADFDKAGNMTFGRHLSYVSGDNIRKEPVSMTAPVNQKASSQPEFRAELDRRMNEIITEAFNVLFQSISNAISTRVS